MSYNIEKTNLAEGLLEQIDKSPRFPLGFKARDAEGREYVYVKAIKNLTAGVPVLGVARTALTVGLRFKAYIDFVPCRPSRLSVPKLDRRHAN